MHVTGGDRKCQDHEGGGWMWQAMARCGQKRSGRVDEVGYDRK